MYLKKMKSKNTVETSRQPNRIASDTQVTGDMTSTADFRIDGTMLGNIYTSGKVVIGKEGAVHGKIACQQADIEGGFSGELAVIELLSLRSSANVQGEVITAKLAVEPGAIFNVLCSMKNTAMKSLPPDKPTNIEKTA